LIGLAIVALFYLHALVWNHGEGHQRKSFKTHKLCGHNNPVYDMDFANREPIANAIWEWLCHLPFASLTVALNMS
jgi:hypothetical protein